LSALHPETIAARIEGGEKLEENEK